MSENSVQPARYCTHGYSLCIRAPHGGLAHDAAALKYLPATDPRVVVYLADPINRKLAEDLGAIASARSIITASCEAHDERAGAPRVFLVGRLSA